QQRYLKKNTRRNYHRHVKQCLNWIRDNTDTVDTDNLDEHDLGAYQAYCNDTYKQNGNVGRLHAVNNFTCKFLDREDLRVQVPPPIAVNKPVLSEKVLKRYIAAADNPLEYAIVILQIDGLLRPTEIVELKISNIDFDNRMLYIDDSKTGDNYIIMSPRLMLSLHDSLRYRYPPKRAEDQDRLFIIDKGSHTGLAPQTGRGDYVYNATKRIAARAGFERPVYPYLIKPSVITNNFNNQVNPKIIQRKARHKRIESTLRYDHTTDAMVMEHWDKMQPDVQVPQDDPVARKPVDQQPVESTPADGSSADQNPRKTCSILVDHEPDGQKKDYLQHNLDRYLNTA
ncbi:MAG: tyrosine-type recombinase/integrase, partial [Thermoplasmatota archaeon]